MTKEIDFQESLVKSFYLYMGFLAMNGFTPCGLFSLFFKNNVSIYGDKILITSMSGWNHKLEGLQLNPRSPPFVRICYFTRGMGKTQ